MSTRLAKKLQASRDQFLAGVPSKAVFRVQSVPWVSCEQEIGSSRLYNDVHEGSVSPTRGLTKSM